MRDVFRGLFVVLATASVLAALVYALHEEHQEEVEKRALLLEQKDCYSWQEIEYVVFGETQE